MIPAEGYFSNQEIERSRAYHRPLYRFAALRATIGFAILSALTFTSLGDWLAAPVDDLPLWAYGLTFPAVVVVVGAILRLPFSWWRYRYERRWGFSTQSPGGWFLDWAKAVGVSVVIAAAVLFGLVKVAAALPHAWPLVVAPSAALLVVVLSFVGPVILEPMFNRFRPLDDPGLVAGLRALSARAGVPVRDVLVADASRRTTKHNAYVSGLGATRRVVLFDTLLDGASPMDVELVVAHELGHRRARHVARSTMIGAAGAGLGVVLLWVLLESGAVLDVIRAAGPGDPRITPFALLLGSALGTITLPFGNILSRRWEADADRASIEITGNAEGFAEMERNLAVANLSDLAPSRLAYLLLFTHPSPPERIAAAVTATRPTTG